MPSLMWTKQDGTSLKNNNQLEYTGSEISVELDGIKDLPADFKVEISGNTGTAIGKYTATATITWDTKNYNVSGVTKDGEHTLSIEWEITQTKAVISFNGTDFNLTYNGSNQYDEILARFTVTVGGQTITNPTITLSLLDNNGNYTPISEIVDAGTYKLKATVIGSTGTIGEGENVVAATYQGAEYEFEIYINQFKPEINANYNQEAFNFSNVFLRDLPGTVKSNVTVKDLNGNDVKVTDVVLEEDVTKYKFGNYGTLTYECTTPAFNANKEALTSTITFTFTPTDSNNYGSSTLNCTIKFYTVAKIGDTAYGSIEDALAVAGNNTIIVSARSTVGKLEIPIIKNCTIRSGTTLILPWDASGGYNSSGTATLNDGNAGPSNFNDAKCISSVTISSGVKLTVKGSVIIAGQLNGSNGGSAYAGHLSGNYGRIYLEANAAIIADSGAVINCYGVIQETSTGDGNVNGSYVQINSGATLYQPFVLRDFKGGSIMYAFYSKLGDWHSAPFNQFQFTALTAKLIVNYGGVLKAYCNLYAGDRHNFTEGFMVGASGSGAFVELTDSTYSRLEAKYTKSSSDSTSATNSKNDIHIYGGAKANSLSLSIKNPIDLVFGSTITVSSDQFVLGFSWLLNITLDKAENQPSDAIYNMNQDYKLLPGCEFTVAKGATLNIKSLAIYKTASAAGSAAQGCYYDELGTGRYPTNKPDAVFTVNGTVNATNLSGPVHGSEAGGKIVVTGSTSQTTIEITEVNSISAKAKQDIITTLTLWNGIGNDATNSNTPVSSLIGKTITYNGTTWTFKVTVTHDTTYNGGYAFEIDASYQLDLAELINLYKPNAKTGYDFTGWYEDAACTDQNITIESTSIILYGGWKKHEYSFTYQYVSNEEGFTAPELPDDRKNSVPFSIDDVKTFGTAASAGTIFQGWFADAECKIPITSTADLIKASTKDGTEFKVYGAWIGTPYYVTVQYGHSGMEAESLKILSKSDINAYGAPLNWLETYTDHDKDDEFATIDHYVSGWKYNGNEVTDFSFITENTDPNLGTETNPFVIVAVLTKKHTVTIVYNSTSADNGYNTFRDSYVRYIAPGKSFTSDDGIDDGMVMTVNDASTTDTSKKFFFNGWTIKRDGGTTETRDRTVLTPTVENINQNITITAVWAKKHTVTIEITGIGTSASITISGIDNASINTETKKEVYISPDQSTIEVQFNAQGKGGNAWWGSPKNTAGYINGSFINGTETKAKSGSTFSSGSNGEPISIPHTHTLSGESTVVLIAQV